MCTRKAQINRPRPRSAGLRDPLRSLPRATRVVLSGETVGCAVAILGLRAHNARLSWFELHPPPHTVYKTLRCGDGRETGGSQISDRKDRQARRAEMTQQSNPDVP